MKKVLFVKCFEEFTYLAVIYKVLFVKCFEEFTYLAVIYEDAMC